MVFCKHYPISEQAHGFLAQGKEKRWLAGGERWRGRRDRRRGTALGAATTGHEVGRKARRARGRPSSGQPRRGGGTDRASRQGTRRGGSPVLERAGAGRVPVAGAGG